MDMVPDLVQIRALAEEKEDENWRFRRFLKERCELDPAELDERVFELNQASLGGNRLHKLRKLL